MTDALIFNVPMEPGLEFVAIVGAHFPDSERKPGDDVVDEGNRVGLGMSVIDFERSDTGRIINGDVLTALDRFSVFALEGQELDVDLDLMARDLVLIPSGVDFADARAATKLVQAMSPEDAIDPGIRDFDAVIAGEVPDDPDEGPDDKSAADIELSRRSQGQSGWRGSSVRACGSPGRLPPAVGRQLSSDRSSPG